MMVWKRQNYIENEKISGFQGLRQREGRKIFRAVKGFCMLLEVDTDHNAFVKTQCVYISKSEYKQWALDQL